MQSPVTTPGPVEPLDIEDEDEDGERWRKPRRMMT